MNERIEQWIIWIGKHRKWCFSALILAAILSGAALYFKGAFTNDVRHLFPENAESGRTFKLLSESHLADLIQLEFICTDETQTVRDHERWLDEVCRKMQQSDRIRNVVFRYRADDPVAQMGDFADTLPRYHTPDILKSCDPEEAAANALKRLAMPGSAKALRSQPFPQVSGKVMKELQLLDRYSGMDLAPEVPYFASNDLKRAMIVFESDIAVGDADAVRALYAELDTLLSPLPDGLRFRIVSGANHTLGNEEVLKRDATIAGTLSTVLFLLLFLIFYRRDPGALWIPVIPAFASLLALGVMTLFFNEICMYVIGLGSCITGLAIDQGIHIYSACRGCDAKKKAAALANPMILSTATTVIVFIFLAFTGIHAYHQLALFAGLSLVLSCIFALFVLPSLLNTEKVSDPRDPPEWDLKFARTGTLVLLIGGVAALPFLSVNFDLKSLDGTPASVLAEEEDFNAVWREGSMKTALLAASTDSADKSLERLLAVKEKVRNIGIALPPEPSAERQEQNRNLWRTAETAEHIAKLKKATADACVKKGLPAKFFDPFFERLDRAIRSDDLTTPELLRSVMNKMVKDNGKTVAAIAMFEETPDNVRAVRHAIRDLELDNEAAVISGTAFRQMISYDLSLRFLLLMPLCIIGAIALAVWMLRKISHVLLALIPVVSAFCGLFIAGALTNYEITPAAGFALIILTGIAIDYGVYAVHLVQNPEKRSIRSSVLLSALTTIFGAGALIFSRHPALFGTGVVLSLGITIACFSGLYLVPALAKKIKVTVLLSGCTIPLFFCACTATGGTPLADHPRKIQLEKAADLLPGGEGIVHLQAKALCRFRDMEHAMILAGKIDPVQKKIELAGISSAGTLIFKTDGKDCVPGPGIPDSAKQIFRQIPEDAANIFLFNTDQALAENTADGYITLKAQNGTGSLFQQQPDGALRLTERWNTRHWHCHYDADGKTIRYRRYGILRGYELELTLTKICRRKK